MINIGKQVAYWRDGAMEDWAVARDLVARGRTRHGLFFAHLALEKILKAHVCRQTQELAPRLHSLPRLGELAQLQLTAEQLNVLGEMTTFNIEGRYPNTLMPAPTTEEARRYLARAEEVFQCLIHQL